MAKEGDNLSEIRIGNIGGDLSGNVAGRDISVSQVAQPIPTNKDEALTELKQLLANLQQQLAEITAQQEALKAIAPDALADAEGAQAVIQDAAAKVEAGPGPETAKEAESSLKRATRKLSDLLDGATTVAQKANQVGEAVKPIVAKLTPIVETMGRALILIKLLTGG